MKKYLLQLIVLLLFVSGSGEAGEKNQMTIDIKIGEKTYTSILSDNKTTRELMKRLPLTLKMNDLYQNEKYAFLPEPLPEKPQAVQQIRTGDLMLYGSNCLVLFYQNFPTSYSYTVLGKIENTGDLSKVLGNGNIHVTIQKKPKKEKSSLPPSASCL